MSISPLRAFTGTPSISILTRSSAMLMSGRGSGRRLRPQSVAHDATATVIDHVFELVPVVPEEALHRPGRGVAECADGVPLDAVRDVQRSEEHTSELQSPCNLVCRLLLEKKKKTHLTVSCDVKSL